jgi:signal peptide peptidase SppA
MSNARSAFSRMHLREAYVMPQTADIFVSHLTQLAGVHPDHTAALEAAAFASLEESYGYGSDTAESRKPFVYQDGVAVIPVHGALLNRFGGAYSFATGYNYIRRMMNAAIEDDDVQLIVLDVDSPGGEAAGCMELAEEIREARDSKPILSVVDSLSCSAGYALASAASRMVATPSSKIGSIGVVLMHMNVKGALDQMGVEVTFIEAPEDGMKTAGNPFEPLSNEAKKDFQASVNKAYDTFVDLIAENRALDEDSVRDTKARVFRADEALALRLIDEVKTPSEAVSAFVAELADEDDPNHEEDEDMADPKKPAAAAPAAGTEATSAAPDAAAIQAAVNADRERMSAIKALPEAASRPKLADKLALKGMSVDDAKDILGDAAEEGAAAPAPAAEPAPAAAAPAVDATNHLAAAMDATKQPDVGAGAGDAAAAAAAGAAPSEEDLSAAILKDQGAMIGRNFGEQSKAA